LSILTLSSPSLLWPKDRLFEQDNWTFIELGYSDTELPGGQRALHFKNIEIPWMKELTKNLVWRKRNSVTHYTLIGYLRLIRSLSTYIVDTYGVNFKISALVRPVIEGYLNLIASKSISTRNSARTTLTEIFACWQEWGELSSSIAKLIRKEDIPRLPRPRKPKVINTHAQQQLAQNLETPKNMLERMIATLMEVGMRGSEMLALKQDCLSTDDEGDWYLKRLNLKFREEHMVPISHRLAEIIRAQVAHAKEIERSSNLVNSNNWLFIHNYRGVLRRYTMRSLAFFLVDYALETKLTNEFGDPISLTSHQFRHTVGTNFVNNNVSLYYVQKYLGHKSSAMTMVYAEINDVSLKQAIQKANNHLVDIRGKLYNSGELFKDMGLNITDQTTLDSRWLKKQIATQALPNGVCALPIRQKCPHANACLTCPSFRTDSTFLPTHKEQLARTKELMQAAEKNQLTRQHELNKNVAHSLETIIGAIESNG